MLKIKDNVDLKELEKFGFKLNYDEEYEIRIEKNNVFTIIVIKHDNTVYIQSNSYVIKELDLLFDLIKAGLIEKVGN